jgi:hypothetical protein
MKKLISLLFILSISFAQQTWIRTYGGTNDDVGWSAQQTTDRGYIVVGNTRSFGAGNDDVYLIKTDSTGDTLWTRTFGGMNSDFGNSVQQTSDGGYIVVGYTNSFGVVMFNVWLIKTDSLGDTLWTRIFVGTQEDVGLSVQQTSDGGYIVAGYTGASCADVYLIKTDSTGDTLWTRTYGGPYHNGGWSVQQTSDGGYIVAGFTTYSGANDMNVYLIKTNSTGDTLWIRAYGGMYDDAGYSVQQTSDGGYIVVGYTESSGAGGEDVYLIKTDTSGDTIWTRAYGGMNSDLGYSVQQTSDGGYIVAGFTNSFGAGFLDVYLIKTDSTGDTIWTRTYGGMNFEYGYSVQQTLDGGYIIAGVTGPYEAGYRDVYLIKTDANGYAAVEERKSRTQNLEVRLKAVPNPFRTITNISLGHSAKSMELKIYDMAGRIIRSFPLGSMPSALCWDGTDQTGRPVPSGVYFAVPKNKNISPLRIVKIR